MSIRDLVFCASVAAAGFAFGCSSSKGTDGTNNNNGNNFNAGGGAGNTNNGTVLQPGQGMTAITQAQADSYNGTACAGQSGEPEPTASLLEFVLDVSGTMRSTTTTTGGLTKWAVCAASMQTALTSLPDTQAVGLEFFPNADNGGAGTDINAQRGQCIDHGKDVTIGILAAAQRTAINSALTSIVPFANAATPTEDALKYAYQQLDNSPLLGAKYAVLITDGQPTLRTPCTGMADPRNPEPSDAIIKLIGDALAGSNSTVTRSPIKTFIVGSPGSEVTNGNGADARSLLSDEATAGGTALPGCSRTGPNYCHFDMTQSQSFGTALTQALVQIGAAAVSCDYTVPASTSSGAIDPNKVNIVYTAGDGTIYAIGRNTAADCQTGWHYTDTTNTQIHICGDSCTKVLSDAKAVLHLYYGCSTPILVN